MWAKVKSAKVKKRFSMYNLPISHRGLASDSIKISGSLCFLFNTIFIPPSRPFAASTGGRTYLWCLDTEFSQYTAAEFRLPPE